MNTIIVIPARLKSTRLPNKILLKIGDKPIIQHVYERCIKVKNVDKVVIAVDSIRAFKECEKFTSDVIMTNDNHMSGTDRIAEVVVKLDPKFVINVQGDEPFIDIDLVSRIAEEINGNNEDMVTAGVYCYNEEDYYNSNVVKIVKDFNDRALYFSRSPIPYDREKRNVPETGFLRHIGIYAYKNSVLKEIVNTPIPEIENLEKLEQLRALYIGKRIKVLITTDNSRGIDTLEDYKRSLQIHDQGI